MVQTLLAACFPSHSLTVLEEVTCYYTTSRPQALTANDVRTCNCIVTLLSDLRHYRNALTCLLAMFLAVTVLLLVHLSLVTCAYVSAAACHRSEVEKDISTAPVDSCGPAATSVPTDEESVSSVAVVHRKHKKIHRSAAAAAAASTATLPESSVAGETQVPMAPVNPYRKPANPYVAYRNIKMKVN